MIFRCQPGFETLLEKEVRADGLPAMELGAGWLRTPDPDHAQASAWEWCFAHAAVPEPVEITGESVNALAGKIAEFFLAAVRAERIEAAWPCCFESGAGLDGLGRRVTAVERAFFELLKRKMARVARLAVTEKPAGVGMVGGLWVCLVDFRRAFVARRWWLGGQRRMADDSLAPSRSYLKIEEAYGLLGREPAPGETVVDLGAAPGGWSYSAAKRGAAVIAVDNGPLKGGALAHPRIEHRREDAFKFRPPAGVTYDWFFCDLVEEPHRVLRDLVAPWLEQAWCRRFVVILKFGRADPLLLLRDVRAAGSPLTRWAPGFRVRHLYHDREEFTLVGERVP